MSHPVSPWRHLWPAALTLTGIGWGTLAYVVLYHVPTLPARLVFFWALIVGVAGLSLLPLALLHRRLRGRVPPSPTLWRESLLAGAFVALWAWLQMDRLASPGALMALGAVLVLVEVFSLLWKGPSGTNGGI